MAIAILLISIIVGGYLIYLGTSRGGVQATPSGITTSSTTTRLPITGERKTYTLSLLPGGKFYYRNSYYAKPGSNPVETAEFWVKISNIDWPFILGIYNVTSQNKTGPARIAIGNMALPLELLGRKEVSIPLIVPAVASGFCASLQLVGEENYTYHNESIRVLKYTVDEALSGFRVKATLLYDAKTGILLQSNFTILSHEKIQFIVVEDLENMTKIGKMHAQTPDYWICNPPLSTDLRFQPEGTYVLQDMKMTPVTLESLRKISLANGIILIIAKDGQQLTQEFWLNVLAATTKCPSAKVYTIVVGTFTDNLTITLARNILERSAASEQIVLIKFNNGKAVGKVYRYGDLNEIVNLLCGS